MSPPPTDPLSPYRLGLLTNRWFAGLPSAMQDVLLAGAVLHHLPSGERLFSRGDDYDGIYCVAKGALRVLGVHENGKEALLAMAEPYGWLGEIALFDGLPRTHDAIAAQASVVIRIPAAHLSDMLAVHPDWWRCFGVLLSQKMRFAFMALEEAALLPIPLRIARRLVLMAEGYGELMDRTRRVLPLPQDQLASMLSVSRQTINQVLRQFESQGLLKLNYREMEILDLPGLRQAGSPADPVD